jgi:hypothetical protein
MALTQPFEYAIIQVASESKDFIPDRCANNNAFNEFEHFRTTMAKLRRNCADRNTFFL